MVRTQQELMLALQMEAMIKPVKQTEWMAQQARLEDIKEEMRARSRIDKTLGRGRRKKKR